MMGRVFFSGGKVGMKKPITVDENTVLLLHGDQLADSSVYGRAISSNNGVTVSNAQSKFGGSSLYFNGSAYLTIDVPVSGDLTFECWIYTTEFKNLATPFNHLNGGLRGYYAHVLSGEFAPAAYKSSGSSNPGQDLHFDAIPANSWHHIAMVRIGTTMSVYLDGVLKGSLSDVHTDNDTLYLGTLEANISGCTFKGYLDEIRISDVARWTSNFTPPTKPY